MDHQLALTPIGFGDLPFVQEVRNHPETLPFLHDQTKFTLEQTEDWFTERPPWRIILVDGERVGYVRISDIDKRNKQVKVGVDIHPDHRRKGYATEALVMVLQEFALRGFHRAWLEVLEGNVRAEQLYRSLGFESYGETYQSVMNYDADGKEVWHNSILMEKLLCPSAKTTTGSRS